MFRHSALARKTVAALKLLRTGGLKALASEARRRAAVWRVCLAARRLKSIDIDGCSIGLAGIPTGAMKASLLQRDYESFERSAALRYLRPDLPVVELGGCIGVVACVTNRLLSHPERHVVVEANPRVLPLLENNRRLNGCRFEILNRAIAYGAHELTFSPAPDPRVTLLPRAGRRRFESLPVTVKTTTLERIVAERGFDRFTLICDIEGHECDLVQNEAPILRRIDTIILETHARFIGDARNRAMLDTLAQHGFRTIASESSVLVLKQESLPSLLGIDQSLQATRPAPHTTSWN